MERSERALTEAERRMLRLRLTTLERRRRSAARRAAGSAGFICGGLWLATIAASDVSWPIITLFWLVVAAVLGLWVFRSQVGSLRASIVDVESAIRRKQAVVHSVRCSDLVEVEEAEDEGACWLLQLPGERVLVLAGQEYYATARFPSDDFSLVEILREDGRPLERLIEAGGRKLAPSRKLPAELRRNLPSEETWQVLHGSIHEVESLRRVDSSGVEPRDPSNRRG